MDFEKTFQGVSYVKPVPTIAVDLSLSPLERWRLVLNQCTEHGLSVHKLVGESQKYLDDMLPERILWMDLRSSSTSFVGRWIRYLFLLLLGLMCRVFFYYSDDVVALATLVQRLPGEIFLANLAYEILGGCTSFVVHDENGKPMLARTLDWPMPMLGRYTVQFRWIRSCKDGADETVFYSVGWPGYVGVMTAVKPGKFSVALNARYCPPRRSSWCGWVVRGVLDYTYACDDRDEQEEVVAQAMRMLSTLSTSMNPFNRAWSSGSLLRYSLQNSSIDSFERAVSLLGETKVVSACYFIFAGVKSDEGVVITRDSQPARTFSFDSIDKRFMNTVACDSRRFVCQTNHDIPFSEDFSPDDFNSVERHEIIRDILLRSHHHCEERFHAATAARALMTSIVSKKETGVRMKMTLFCSIMCAYIVSEGSAPLVTARATRQLGV